MARIGALLPGGRDPAQRSVMGLGTAQRNLAAAVVAAGQDFSGTPTLRFVLVGAVLLPPVLLPSAKLLGARSLADEPQAAPTGAQTRQVNAHDSPLGQKEL
jgi:BASS family bile acid:Na+ symporter